MWTVTVRRESALFSSSFAPRRLLVSQRCPALSSPAVPPLVPPSPRSVCMDVCTYFARRLAVPSRYESPVFIVASIRATLSPVVIGVNRGEGNAMVNRRYRELDAKSARALLLAFPIEYELMCVCVCGIYKSRDAETHERASSVRIC